MAGAHAFAAVDLGASSGRVILGVHEDGALGLEEVHRFPNGPVLRDGRLEWDAEALFTEIVAGLARTVSVLAERGLALDGIGIDTWGVDYALLDRASGELGPVGHYLGSDPAGPARAAAVVPEERSYAITGVLPQHINTAYRLLADAEADADRRPRTVLLTADLWVYLLTGEVGADRTLASTTQLLDPRTRDWSPELVEAWGLGHLELPAASPAGTLAGHTTPEITARIGAAAAVPVYRVAEHDTASALAFATPGSGELLVSSGSWSLVGVSLPEPLTTPAALAAGFTNELAADGSVLLLRNLPGMLLLGECVRRWEAEGREVPEVLALVLDAAELPGSVFDVDDERLLTTDDIPRTIAELCREAGAPEPADEVGFAASVVASLARAYADSVRLVGELTGRPIESIRVVGGGSLNAALCARTAALAGLPVIAGPAEASALGNLAVQLVAAGAAADLGAAYADAEVVTRIRRYDPPHPEGPA